MDNINTNINSDEPKATSTGIMIKSFIGVMIAFFIAIPRLSTGNYFGAFFFAGGPFGDLIGSIIFAIILGIIWAFLFRLLKKDQGPALNLIIYIITCVFTGLFLANSLIVAVNWISVYGGDLNVQDIVYALKLTAMLTFIAVIGGILILPKIKMTEKTIKFARNASLIVVGLAMASFITYILGLIFMMFGSTIIMDFYGNLFYGSGIVSILISFLGVIGAEVLFLGTLASVKFGIGRAPKHEEYLLSMVLVNGIIRLYVELFKLVLKIIARRNRN